MNAFNAQQLERDDSGLLESCDNCNRLIINWEVITEAVLGFDGKVRCKRCDEMVSRRRIELLPSA